MILLAAILAAMSVWDYPARYPAHCRLRQQFVRAVRTGDTATMESTCRKGVTLLPDDPTWHYNLACSLAYFDKREDAAFDELEQAIDLGFRDREKIAADTDLKRLKSFPRYAELLDYAGKMRNRPLMLGPLATVDATGIFGQPIALGEQNLGWDFDVGCFVAKLKLAAASAGPNVGDLYVNRDALHSVLDVSRFPGVTPVRLDQAGRERKMDLNAPNMLFPYPVFGNSSRAYLEGLYWRSIPRMMMTIEAAQLGRMVKFYLTNQTWVFPANADLAPVGTNGDVFASITPYWITTAGRSYSDLPYLRAALTVSQTLQPAVKRELVRRGLLAPTIQTLIRKSIFGVTNETAYLTAQAHPTAFRAGGFSSRRLVEQATALQTSEIPPLAVVNVTPDAAQPSGTWPELTYSTAFAWAYVLRAEQDERTFCVDAKGASEFAFAQTHGEGTTVRIVREGASRARITIDRRGLSPTNRVDIAVFGRNPGTGWGAPSYISFARMDASAPYSDPVLTPHVNSPEK